MRIVLSAFFLSLLLSDMNGQSFVAVENGNFMLDGRPYRFLGTNFWYGMQLGSEVTGDRDRLLRELDQLKDLGLTNLRIMASSEGPSSEPWRVTPAMMESPGDYKDHLWEGLDFLLSEMSKRDMKAVLCLSNFWPWSGGMSQLVSWADDEKIPYPPPEEHGSWVKYMLFTSRFYVNDRAKEYLNQHIEKVLTRINSITGQDYKNDPTIMAWQLANEPRGMARSRSFRRWIKATARLIKATDQNHLVSLGSEGNTSSMLAGNRFQKDHAIAEIDYCTAHVWVENWGWYDPEDPSSFEKGMEKALDYIEEHHTMAKRLGKPFVLEEFGIARDRRSFLTSSQVKTRIRYFERIFEQGLNFMKEGVYCGLNFWAWGGEGRPTSPGEFWKRGDDYIGDPPHEQQGWYSIYQSDSTSHALFKEWTAKIGQMAR